MDRLGTVGLVADAVEAWSKRPTGEPPAPGQRLPTAGAIIVKLDKSDLGIGFHLTKAGRALPAGN